MKLRVSVELDKIPSRRAAKFIKLQAKKLANEARRKLVRRMRKWRDDVSKG